MDETNETQRDEENSEVGQKAAGRISAHLDIGTIVTGLIGFTLAFLVNRGIDNLDTLTAEVGKLNQQVAVILVTNEAKDKRDASQDERIFRHDEQIKEIYKLLGTLGRYSKDREEPQ